MSVQFDLLDDVLNTIRLNGTIYFQKKFSGNWGVQTPATTFKKFMIIVEGECWLQWPSMEAPILLNSGDIAAFPHGTPYQLGVQRDSPWVPMDTLADVSYYHVPSNVPDHVPATAEDSACTTIIFGHVEFTRDFSHPFMSNLPPVIHISASDDRLDMLRVVASLIIAESGVSLPGSQSITKRLAEVLHLHMLRAYVLSQKGAGSFPAVFDEPAIYQSLRLIHNQLAFDWTLEQLALQVNLSRTVFAVRFREIMGMPPMSYIRMWRMQKARELLELSGISLLGIALEVGYGSEAAFSRAFQHEFHETPGRYRHRFR